MHCLLKCPSKPVGARQMRQKSNVTPLRSCRCAEIKKAMDTAERKALELCREMPGAPETQAAWDELWDLEHAYHCEKEKIEKDPLQVYCKEFPDADECREYDI
jgi:hypothetical protein